MKCQDCGDRESTVRITQIVNNEKVVLNLCKRCAGERGFHSPLDNTPFPLASFLSGMLTKDESSAKALSISKSDLVCPNCGLDLEKFKELGRFGCSQCYQIFREQLQDILRRIHGSSLHRGKLPPMLSEEASLIKEQERLQEELQRAINSEDFERAADLRDKLKSLEQVVRNVMEEERRNV
jgi:protein arginine kinase activator